MPPRKPPAGQLLKFFQDVDDVSKILTGKGVKDLISRGVAVLGPEIQTNDPYSILGVRSTASQKVVDWAYRAMAHESHPDSGTNPNEEKMKAINSAYDKIKEERKGSK